MSKLKQLQESQSIADVAKILGLKTKSLTYILYVRSESDNYKDFDIPKKTGGVRHISAPQDRLKKIQRQLSQVLQDCLDEIEDSADGHKLKSFNQASHGFKRKSSILTNARKHRNKRYVFNLDLADFFRAINFGRVRGFFIRDNRFSLNPKVATIIAQIACFRGSLPQGSPCSPVISNLIGGILDSHLARLASKNGCFYTRYADDLTFSTNKRCFPREIAIQNDDIPHVWLPGQKLVHFIGKSGFEINPKKTRMQYHFSRQEVTGLTVNKRVNVRNEYRHNVRAMVDHLFKKGQFFFTAYKKDQEDNYTLQKVSGNLNQLHGRLGFINDIDRHNLRMNLTSLEHRDRKKESIYRSFLFYKEFYVAAKPVLICEGPTDCIYIESALRQLSSHYPMLISSDSNGKFIFNIKRFKYRSSTITELLGIKGGTGGFSDFLKSYKHEFNNFHSSRINEPVIILVDNDSAGQNVLKAAFGIFSNGRKKTNCDDREPFHHLYKNLYLILTPLPESKTTSIIEDLFEDSVLGMKINGKTFNRQNQEATESTYGKTVFAKQVIEAQASLISFEGFIPLLDRIVQVIVDFHDRTLKSENL